MSVLSNVESVTRVQQDSAQQAGGMRVADQDSLLGRVAQLVRAFGLHPTGRGFESLFVHGVCLLVSSGTVKAKLALWGSSTIGSASALQAEGCEFESRLFHRALSSVDG